jgi:hypothetical protein
MSAGPAGYSRDEDIAAAARDRLDRAAAAVEAMARLQREVVAELIELWPTSAWLASGVRSAKDWLLAYTPLSYHEALRLEQVAELCAAHPDLADAVVSGVMPMKRAMLLGRTVTEQRAGFFAEILPTMLRLNAETGDDDAFAEAVRFWAGQVDQETAVRRVHQHALSATPSLFGGGEIHAHLAPGAYANVMAAIDGFTQDPDPADAPYRRSFCERRADALDDICAAALAGTPGADDDLDDDEIDWEDLRATDTWDGSCDTDVLDEQLADEDVDELDALRRRLAAQETQRRRRARRRTRIRSGATITAVVDVRTLLGARDRTDLDDLVLRGDGWTMTRSLLERLSCDTGLVATLMDGRNRILDANARTERFTASQRRAIAARDRCCVFPGCRRPPRHCDTHHLHERHHGGPTTTANGALLCRFHHRLVHEHGWRLKVLDGMWTAIDRHGHTWTGRPAPPTPATAA